MKIKIETSARHIHLNENDLKKLFGDNAKLTPKKDLSQPGQFVSEERVTLVGPKRELKNVCIIGPVRKNTQVELSATDARSIGVQAPVRESGQIEGTPGCKIVGPKGEIEIENGVIVAKRHLHLTTKDAEDNNIKDGEIVAVEINSEERSLIFGDVVARVNDNFAPAMHIDTDESNSAGIKGNIEGKIIKL